MSKKNRWLLPVACALVLVTMPLAAAPWAQGSTAEVGWWNALESAFEQAASSLRSVWLPDESTDPASGLSATPTSADSPPGSDTERSGTVDPNG